MNEVTREILWNIGSLSKAAMYTLMVVSMVVAGYGIYRRVRVWRRGVPGADSAISAQRLGRVPVPFG